MTIKLRKQVINILKTLQNRSSDAIATDLAQDLEIDYIVLMSAVNDLIDYELGGFKEYEINQITLNDEGKSYLKQGLPERRLLNLMLKDEIKEIEIEDLLKRSKLEEKIFYVGISNLQKN